MPDIRVMYWNVQNFGDAHPCRGNYVPLCNFIAKAVKNVDADILCLLELRQAGTGLGAALEILQRSLLAAFAVPGIGYTCDWLCDWVPGAVVYNDFTYLPFNPNLVDFTFLGRDEGYAVFWRQNIAKFTMRPADPIENGVSTPPPHVPAPGFTGNTQSGGTRARGMFAVLPVGANIVPGGAPQYLLPAGSHAGPNGITRAGAAAPLAGGAFAAANIPLRAADVMSAGTLIAAHGVRLINPVLATNSIAIPGGYQLTADLTLPGAGEILAPIHALSLVMTSRVAGMGGAPYDPAVLLNNAWQSPLFPGTDGANFWNGVRRPAFCTIKVTAPPGTAPAQQLLPITVYHAPVAAPNQAMLRCALSRSLYETITAGVYLHNARALVGGDFNESLDPAAHPYAVYTDTYPLDGADCNDGAGAPVPNIRVNQPAPGMAPAFPPFVPPLTPAMTPENRSTVQLRYPVINGTRVLSANTDHYRQLAIDNIFYRGFLAAAPGQAPRCEFRATVGGVQQQFEADVYDLVRAVRRTLPPGAAPAGAGAPADNFFFPAAFVQSFLAVPALHAMWAGFLAAALNQSIAPVSLFRDVFWGRFPNPNWPNPPSGGGAFVPAPAPPLVPPERRAAEFIKLFVSDHLPILFRMNF